MAFYIDRFVGKLVYLQYVKKEDLQDKEDVNKQNRTSALATQNDSRRTALLGVEDQSCRRWV
jgi:hypothetical protein